MTKYFIPEDNVYRYYLSYCQILREGLERKVAIR